MRDLGYGKSAASRIFSNIGYVLAQNITYIGEIETSKVKREETTGKLNWRDTELYPHLEERIQSLRNILPSLSTPMCSPSFTTTPFTRIYLNPEAS